MNKFKYLLILLISVLLSNISMFLIFKKLDLLNNNESFKTINEINIKEENNLSSSIKKVYDSVVVIETYKNNRLIGSGTGFFYKTEKSGAYIITNYHVVSNSNDIKIIDSHDGEYSADIVGFDEYLDVAILFIKTDNQVKIASLKDSSFINVGDTVFTVGSPLGIKYQGTVTKGILSGKNRQITVNTKSGNFIMDVLQTDAAINPGNSGGPLLNINGEVIGVTSLKLVEDEIEGMGFAIPIELIKNVVDRLENGKKIDRPLLGIKLLNLDDTYLIKSYDINIDTKELNGIVVANVEKNSPADISKLKKGDIILKINDDEIIDSAHFRYILYKYEINDIIKITYMRNNKKNVVNVKLNKKL